MQNVLEPAQAAERIFTYDELVAEMPETTQPHELWAGKLIILPTPSYFHQKITFRFSKKLDAWVSKRSLGEVIIAPIDMVLSPHHCVQPDVAFIGKQRLDIIKRVIMGPVDLAAEVVSLHGRTRDRLEKRDLYEQYGVKEYWIIDPEAQTIDVLALENGAYKLAMRAGSGEVARSPLLPGFEVQVNALFQA